MTETTINFIVSSIITLYLLPLAFDMFVFSLLKHANDNSETKDEYPYRKFMILSLIPIFNIVLEFILVVMTIMALWDIRRKYD